MYIIKSVYSSTCYLKLIASSQAIPAEDWFCPECRPKQRSHRLPSRQRSSIDSEELESDRGEEEEEEDESEEEQEESGEEESEEERER